jgi:hypothetical protein
MANVISLGASSNKFYYWTFMFIQILVIQIMYFNFCSVASGQMFQLDGFLLALGISQITIWTLKLYFFCKKEIFFLSLQFSAFICRGLDKFLDFLD